MKFIFLAGLLALSSADLVRKYQLPLCREEAVTTYKLHDPGSCSTNNESTRYIKGVTVYKPYNPIIHIPAVGCREIVDFHSCTKFFFGAESCRLLGTSYLPVSKSSCDKAARTHYTSYGSLFPKDDKTMSTKNTLHPSFHWPTSKTIRVVNYVLTVLTISKDISKEEYMHISLGKLDCDSLKQTCTSASWRVNFKEPVAKTCQIAKMSNMTLTLHPTTQGFLFQIAEANIVASVISECSNEASKCIKKSDGEKLICTLSGHIISIPESVNISTTREAEGELPATLRHIHSAIVANANRDLLNIKVLEKFIQESLCESARATIIALIGSQRFNPSEVLSFLLQKEVQAVFAAGTLRLLKCSTVEAILQPTLVTRGKVSDRPLFQAYVGTGAVLTSLRQGRFLSEKIATTLHKSRKKTFAFLNDALVFENNTLSETRPLIKRVTIKHLNLNETFYKINEEELHDDFVMSSTEEDMRDQQLKNLVELTRVEYQQKGVNIDDWLHEDHSIDSDFFSNIYNSIKETLWGHTESVLLRLSQAYTVIFTVVILLLLVQSAKSALSKRIERKHGPNENREVVETVC